MFYLAQIFTGLVWAFKAALMIGLAVLIVLAIKALRIYIRKNK